MESLQVFRKCVNRVSPCNQLKGKSFSCPARSNAEEISSQHVKPFDSIPGPKSIPVIGTLWKYLPVIGEYRFDRMLENGMIKLRKYGPIVREDILPGVPIVNVFSPKDIEMVYRCEGKHPARRSHLAVEKYRKDRPSIYNSGGLLPTNGEDWGRLRSVFQRSLSRMQDVHSYLPITDSIMQEFLQFAVSSPNVTDILPKLSRLYLELTSEIAFSSRLNCFSIAEQAPNSRSSKLIHAALTFNSCIMRTDNGPQLWKYWRTPLYRRLERALAVVEETAVELVLKVQANKEDHTSMIAVYLSYPNIDLKDINGMAVDLILAGIDTTTYTSCFALYYLAINPHIQERLYKEICQLLPTDQDRITPEIIERAQVTRMVIKETLRLNPVSIGIGRILAKDAIMSGYHVPAGTVVVTQNHVSCRQEQYFPRPLEFIPERWNRHSPDYKPPNPYLLLPFGHGPRACIARRLAEQNMFVLLLRMVREYKLTWHGGKLGVRSVLVNKPDKPVLLGLQKR